MQPSVCESYPRTVAKNDVFIKGNGSSQHFTLSESLLPVGKITMDKAIPRKFTTSNIIHNNPREHWKFLQYSKEAPLSQQSACYQGFCGDLLEAEGYIY